MKKLKYLLLIIVLLLSINVKADDVCEKTELARLKELAKTVEFDYDYQLIDDDVNFSIKAVNLNSELKVAIIEDDYLDKYKEFKDNSNHTATLNGFKSGEVVVVTIKAFVPNWCSGEVLTRRTIKLPYYNFFYDEDKCKNNEDFKYCKQLISSDISQNTFDSEFELYLAKKTANSEKEIVPASSTWKVLIIIGAIVLALAVLVGIVMLIIRKRRRNSL